MLPAKAQRTLFDTIGDDRWTSDDYHQSSAEVLPLFDPWASFSGKPAVAADEPCFKPENEVDAGEGSVPIDGRNAFWFEVPNGPEADFAPAEDWEFPSLPHFDPQLHRDVSSRVDFDEPLRRGAHFKARMVADLSLIATPWERTKLIRRLEDLFEEYPSAATYHRWTEIAVDLCDVQTVDLALALRMTWDATPEFWLYRVGPNAAPRFSEQARDQLGWASAIRIADCDPSRPVDELLNADMLVEWRDLQGPCLGSGHSAHTWK